MKIDAIIQSLVGFVERMDPTAVPPDVQMAMESARVLGWGQGKVGRFTVDHPMLYTETEEIGCTSSTPHGYTSRVVLAETAEGGLRVRIEIIKDGRRRHFLDLSGPIASELWPLVRRAADRGRARKRTNQSPA